MRTEKLLVKRILLIILGCVLAFFVLFQERIEACFQPESPSVKLRADSIVGSISLNGKPLEGALLSLHKFLGPYSIERGNADARSIGRATTEKDGTFRFAKVPSGKYVLMMSRPSHEFTNIELITPKKGEKDTVVVEYFADFCARAAVIDADGRRFGESKPTVFGIAP